MSCQSVNEVLGRSRVDRGRSGRRRERVGSGSLDGSVYRHSGEVGSCQRGEGLERRSRHGRVLMSDKIRQTLRLRVRLVAIRLECNEDRSVSWDSRNGTT